VRRQKLYIVAQAHPSNSSFRKKQRQRQIKEEEHKARPSRLDLDQIVSKRCNPEQDQDKGSLENFAFLITFFASFFLCFDFFPIPGIASSRAARPDPLKVIKLFLAAPAHNRWRGDRVT
jgi:hypothetical protein